MILKASLSPSPSTSNNEHHGRFNSGATNEEVVEFVRMRMAADETPEQVSVRMCKLTQRVASV